MVSVDCQKYLTIFLDFSYLEESFLTLQMFKGNQIMIPGKEHTQCSTVYAHMYIHTVITYVFILHIF